MRSLTDASSVRRVFLILTVTRWLPTGLLVPVTIVLAQERGLSLATIGGLWAVQGLVVMGLELPTGGLADAIGRRRVLLTAGLFALAATAVLSVATSLALFVVVMILDGVYRALESGPLEAWYVDASQAQDAAADIEAGLAARGVALGVALSVGSLVGGGLALLPQPQRLPALALPVLVSVGLRLVDIAAVAALLVEAPADRPRVAGSIVRTGATIREAIRLLASSHALLALAAIELLWGAGQVGVEMLSAPRMVEITGDVGSGVAAIAVAGAVAWAISGFGSGLAPWLQRRTRSWVAAAILTRVVQGGAVAVAALIAGPAGLLIGYLGFFLVHGAANVAHYGLVHRNVDSAHRATMVSINGLTSRFGGTITSPLLGALAVAAGIPAAFAVSALLLALPAPLYLAVRNGRAGQSYTIPVTSR